MKKLIQHRLFLPLLVIISVLVILILLRTIPIPAKKISSLTSLHVTNQRITDASASIKYKIDVSYPLFSGFSSQETEHQVNNLITKQVIDGVNAFKTEVNSTEEASGSLPPAIQAMINEYYVTYNVARADSNVVSISFANMDYQAGMDHPLNYTTVFNYDVERTKVIHLSDLFTQNSNYLQFLSNEAKEQLTKRFADNPYARDFINDGAAPKAENFTNFTITTDNLTLIFDPYQVAPYYAGTQTVSIPFKDMSTILNPLYLN